MQTYFYECTYVCVLFPVIDCLYLWLVCRGMREVEWLFNSGCLALGNRQYKHCFDYLCRFSIICHIVVCLWKKSTADTRYSTFAWRNCVTS
jgi:hypothetical protein